MRVSAAFIFLLVYNVSFAQTVTLLAGSATGGSGMTNASGSSASFNSPYGVVADNAGNLFVADEANNQIRKIVISSGAVTLLAGSSTGLSGSTDGTGNGASFNIPIGIACDGTNLYVADDLNNEIRKIVISSGVVTTFAGSTTAGTTDGSGTSAKFNHPHGIVWDGGSNLYVADYGNNRVRQIVISTAAVTTLSSSGLLSNPYGLAYDKVNGNLYVADYGSSTIEKIVVSGPTVSTLAGSSGNTGHVNGSGTSAWFNNPTGVALNGNGNLYVTDQSNNEIRLVVISSAAVSDFAGDFTTSGTTNGTVPAATNAKFNMPGGITIDNSGHIFIGDAFNNEIREIATVTLPIKLLNFSADYISGQKAVSINWSTATETNNKEFTVEKSQDGGAFIEVATISGAGNSSMQHNYLTSDDNPFQGVSYYRLKQTDYDGKSTYSDVVTVYVQYEANLSLYPDPADATLHLQYYFATGYIAEATIMDMSGNVVSNTSFDVKKGNNNLSINTQGLSKGIYVLRLSGKEGDFTYRKFVKQ